MTSSHLLKQLDPRSSWSGFLLVAGLATAIALAALTPSASEGLSAAMNLAYWLTHVFLALGVLVAVQAGLQRLERLDRVSPWLIVILAGMIGAVLFTPIAFGLDEVFPTVADDDDLMPETILDGLVSEFGNLVLPLSLIWTGFNATRLLQIDDGQPPAGATAVNEPELDEFWARIPAHLGRDLVAVSSELHYLRVYTSEGDTLILHAFGRALDHLSGIAGMRIHRSHWIALDHVRSVQRKGEKVVCQLDNGIELPVSRPYRAELRSRLQR